MGRVCGPPGLAEEPQNLVDAPVVTGEGSPAGDMPDDVIRQDRLHLVHVAAGERRQGPPNERNVGVLAPYRRRADLLEQAGHVEQAPVLGDPVIDDPQEGHRAIGHRPARR